MAILPIIEAPHPVLAKTARPVAESEFGPELHRFMQDMAETMYAAPGVGLAAPQVGDGRRMLVADPGNDEDGGEPKLYMVVNPQIAEHSSDTITYEESCLSVPGYSLRLKRFSRILLSWQDGLGTRHSQWFEGFPSIVLQHEMDHLEGITLLERSSRFARSRYISKRKKARKRI
jgi:peptide deformylase